MLGDVAQFAMQMLTGGTQLVEGLVWGAALAGGQDADSDADLPVAVQRDLQVFGLGLVGGVEQREGGVAGEDRAEGEVEVEVSENAGLTGIEVDGAPLGVVEQQSDPEHAAHPGVGHCAGREAGPLLVGGQIVGAGDVVPGERLQARSLVCFVLDRAHAVGQLTGAASVCARWPPRMIVSEGE